MPGSTKKKKRSRKKSTKPAKKKGIFGHIVSFVNSFSLTKIIKEIDDLNTQLEADTSAGETYKSLKLPLIIVIGDENSGKSSTLERIAMCEVLPRDGGICTRQPIKMMLRFDPNVPAETPQITLTIPGREPQSGLKAKAVQELITVRMQEIAQDTALQGLILDSEILVEIRSDAHINMDLIDMPGLIAVKANDSASLAERTEDCTRKYLADENTGVVLCVIDATIDNLRVSKAIRLVQDASPEVQKNTIGVLAKADRCEDRLWSDECRSGPLWQLEERLLGKADDLEILKGGVAALVNRNTRSQIQKGMSFEQHAAFEQDWFITHSGLCTDGPETFLSHEEGGERAYSELGKIHLGLHALKEQLSNTMQSHINANWVPEQLALNQTKLEAHKTQLIALGTDPDVLQVPDVLVAINTVLTNAFTPASVDTMCDNVLANLFQGITDPACGTLFEEVKLMCEFRTKALAMVADPQVLVEKLAVACSETIAAAIAADKEGPIQLHRFAGIADLFSHSLRNSLGEQKDEFVTKCTAAVGLVFDMFRLATPVNVAQSVTRVTKCCILESLFLPALGSNSFAFVANAGFNEIPGDSHAPQRAVLTNKVSQLETIIAKLVYLQSRG